EETLRDHPDLESQCSSRLGPTQPGLNYPDTTRRATPREARDRGLRKRADGDRPVPQAQTPAPGDVSTPGPAPSTPAIPPIEVPEGQPNVPLPPLPSVPLPSLPDVGGGGGRSTGDSGGGRSGDQTLLDYLLKP
ncbi:MAG TPA: hypothetical protein VF257_19050, partial [Solirubrobacteraceae bacterium]